MTPLIRNVSFAVLLGPLCISAATQQEASSVALSEVSNSFKELAQGIWQSWREIGLRLASDQAGKVVSEIYTASYSLQNANTALRVKIERGELNRTQFEGSVSSLQDQVRQLQQQLDRFADEIDDASHLNAGPLRAATGRLLQGKSLDLLDLRSTWRENDRDSQMKAVRILISANEDLNQLGRASKCLADSLAVKKQTCDPVTLEHVK